ncbi:bifunctional acetate--CoA ligase family protein/GNAT family N-acetyltransferase [Massilia sp. S19_KUP03_FR1]|uniref:bifunctional acetate--CoA ligase family protein/GNAT family N-acetyltransferase n=1 Tax=Massilia sp. S19_KUP03_FR1 TaxID=3025503 RepID=UPI002FCDB5F7
MLASPFKGVVYAVNPKYETLAGVPVYRDVAALPAAPDLAVICTPAATVPGLIRALGARGTRAAVILSAGLGAPSATPGVTLRQAVLDAARPYLLRILGPNCVGLLAPGIGLNASFAHTAALPGRIAFVSQSGALVTAMLDWAKSRGIGFSRFISIGDSADVDFGDILDYLASDADTDAILLYIEDIRHARKFMSAARAAARAKPVIVLKSGRVAEGARAAMSHTGALAGSDAVYDAAIRRAGMLRVRTTADLFSAVETLARTHALAGERLAIVTNGGGPGVMATDALIAGGGQLAILSSATLAALDALLPATWSRANPVDLIGDAPAERYRAALEVVLRSGDADAVLLIHAPTAIVPSVEVAAAVASIARDGARGLLTCWLGGDALIDARRLCDQAGLATFDTPEQAVDGFLQLVQYARNQRLLMQVPPASAPFQPDRAAVHALLDAHGDGMLSEPAAKAVFAAYGIPVVATRLATSQDAVLAAAAGIGYPVALKIVSPDISHKSDVGGVALDLADGAALAAALSAMRTRVAVHAPQARIDGFAVQAMARRPGAFELIVGAAVDAVFGPVILFGQGGTAVEVDPDRALGLPPLNLVLARDMVGRTRVARLLAGYRKQPGADVDAICAVLIRLAQLVADFPAIAELDLNPLLADASGVLALDGRIRLQAVASGTNGLDRLAIRPYPDQLERIVNWQGAPLTVRPIRPEDGAAHLTFFRALDPEDVRLRTFVHLRELQPAQLARLTQIDYDREMAFIATRPGIGGVNETLGVARAVADPDNQEAEFAVTVRSDLKGQGLGGLLMRALVDYWRARGTARIVGAALAENLAVIRLARSLGFTVQHQAGDGEVRLVRELNPAPAVRLSPLEHR